MGRVAPSGYATSQPDAVGADTVRLRSAAVGPVDGRPAVPATFTFSVPCASSSTALPPVSPRPVWLLSVRVGVTGQAPEPLASKVYQPASAAMRFALPLLLLVSVTLPSASGTVTRLVTDSPVFQYEAVTPWPVVPYGATVSEPAAFVVFSATSSTAVVASAGTPFPPAICTVSDFPVPTGPVTPPVP